MSLFELSGVTKRYGVRKVLDIGHLQIEGRKIYALLGPNGAGKTTLLYLLAFLDAPTAGMIRYRGEPVRHAEPALQRLRREVVLVDQFPILFTTSVRKNLEFGLKIRGIAKDRRVITIEEALEMVGMQQFVDAAAHRLSGGETQRVALARALALSPRVLLCDEPFSNIDAENQPLLMDLVRQIAASKNMTVIFTTHDRRQASELADHTLVLDRGALVPGVYENIFSASIDRNTEDEPCLSIRDVLHLRVPPPLSSVALPRRVRVFIDPAQIDIASVAEDISYSDSAITGRVLQVTHENGGVQIVVDVGVRVTVSMDTQAYRRLKPLVGDRVHLDVPPGATHILD